MIAMAAVSVMQQQQQNEAAGEQNAKQIYNYTADRYAKNIRSQMVLDAGIKNISAVRQEKTLHNTQIRRAEQEAHANATVMAAAAGVEGGSVYDVKSNMSSNAANRISAVNSQADAEERNYINGLYGANYDMSQPFRPPELKLNRWSTIMAGISGGMQGMSYMRTGSMGGMGGKPVQV